MSQASDDPLAWLMNWYAAQCDGEWEHACGVTIQSTDNPGWWLTIDLTGADLRGRPFEPIVHNRDGDRSWWECKVEAEKFHAGCGPFDLPSVISVFRRWAER